MLISNGMNNILKVDLMQVWRQNIHAHTYIPRCETRKQGPFRPLCHQPAAPEIGATFPTAGSGLRNGDGSCFLQATFMKYRQPFPLSSIVWLLFLVRFQSSEIVDYQSLSSLVANLQSFLPRTSFSAIWCDITGAFVGRYIYIFNIFFGVLFLVI